MTDRSRRPYRQANRLPPLVEATIEKVEGAKPGKIYTVFSEEELRDIRETFGWLSSRDLPRLDQL